MGQTRGRLSTHVLDTSTGRPAAGMRIDFSVRDGDKWRLIRTVEANADGRTDAPLLAGAAFAAGTYELVFHMGDYFRATGLTLAEPPFLDVIPLRFAMAADGHYHVPLLASPFSYSTYRGS